MLNHIFRGFHTIKGGAGFLCVQPLVDLCHLTENLFDLLRNGSLKLNPALMDVIMSATGSVRDMFDGLATSGHSGPADAELLADLGGGAIGCHEAPRAQRFDMDAGLLAGGARGWRRARSNSGIRQRVSAWCRDRGSRGGGSRCSRR